MFTFCQFYSIQNEKYKHNFIADNVQIFLTIHGKVEQSTDNKHHVIVTSLRTNSLDISNLKTNMTFNTVSEFLTKTINGIMNGHWKKFKPAIDSTIKEMTTAAIEPVIKPFLDHVAMEDVFNNF